MSAWIHSHTLLSAVAAGVGESHHFSKGTQTHAIRLVTEKQCQDAQVYDMRMCVCLCNADYMQS